mmetsp:Transcript_19034/g.29838  ORF Transcript_19034/g.29838 Transcript_19034/m.29838 type:complete len:377 (-) Transcript_19034:66-1196(-)
MGRGRFQRLESHLSHGNNLGVPSRANEVCCLWLSFDHWLEDGVPGRTTPVKQIGQLQRVGSKVRESMINLFFPFVAPSIHFLIAIFITLLSFSTKASIPANPREPVDGVKIHRLQFVVDSSERIVFDKDIESSGGVAMFNVLHLHMGIKLLHRGNRLSNIFGTGPPPTKQKTTIGIILLEGASRFHQMLLLRFQNVIHNLFHDRLPESGVLDFGKLVVGVAGQTDINEKSPLGQHRRSPISRFNNPLVMKDLSQIIHAPFILPKLPITSSLDETTHSGSLSELGVVPILDGVVEESNASIGLHTRVWSLAKDDALPLVGWRCLEGLESHLTNRHKIFPTAWTNEPVCLGQGFDHWFENGIPHLCPSIKKRFQLKRV